MNILFLQGLSSPFFACLAGALQERGHTIHKLFFCGGDLLFWRWSLGARNHFYKGRSRDLPAYYGTFLKDRNIDAIVLFGDCRPVHRPAISLCRARNIPVFVFEEGYLRPYWITMDRDGANARTSLMRNPAFYQALLKNSTMAAPTGMDVSGGFWRRVAMDIACHTANLLCFPFFPRYRTHRPYIAGIEYAGFIARTIRNIWRRPVYKKRLAAILAEQTPFYFLPLQLDTDYQIRRNSKLRSMGEVLNQVALSFSRYAPAGSRLVVKLHPLDNGLIDYEPLCRRVAMHHGLAGRIVFIDGGSAPDILRSCHGVVTVNSTIGISALHHSQKVKVLGTALYDMEGLTWQGSLDDFWMADFTPDKALFNVFRNVLAEQTQINGSFFTREGQILGACLAAGKIEAVLAQRAQEKITVLPAHHPEAEKTGNLSAAAS